MAVILWAMGLSLVLQGCLCNVGQTNIGCMTWTPKGEDVCCEACHPGYGLVKACGPRPKDLCAPCGPGKFSENKQCTRCTQCVGALVYVKHCTATTDTECGCKEGLTCGDDRCTFCVKKCEKGQEPTDGRSCRPCPHGTFNDQIHQMCKPWSTKCPNPEQKIVAKGDALTDLKCANVSLETVRNPKTPDATEQAWPLVLYVGTSVALTAFVIIIVVTISSIAAKKVIQKRKEERKKPIKETLIIRPPTDEPRTLIAIECSFHEAQQEQGSSSESLVSKDSSEQLIV